jgi:uncharacterized protein
MSEPLTPEPTPTESPVPGPQQTPAEGAAPLAPLHKTPAQRLFSDNGLGAVLSRLLAYYAGKYFTGHALLWLAAPFLAGRSGDVARLWGEMFAEGAGVLAALLPAFLMAKLEGRCFDVYGLPRRQAFGKAFWAGGAWGLATLTILMVALRGMQAFYFGAVVLHGPRALKFALFWGLFFVLVAIAEEFPSRGYMQYTLAGGIGFWPAAMLLSLRFGWLHAGNAGETRMGLLGVVAIALFFCFTLYRTGNLWFAVGFHAFWDWGQTYLYSVPDSGTVEVGHLMHPSFQGPDWLTGGSVGPEGSVLCLAVIAAASALFAWRYRGARYGAESGEVKRNSEPEPSGSGQ